MRLARLHGLEDLSVDEVAPRPVRPGTVRIDIEYCGVCGSDLHEYKHGPAPIRAEDREHRIPESEWDDHLPMPMGHEIVGTVTEIGDGVDRVVTGDRVTLCLILPCDDCRYCADGEYHLCERITGPVATPGFADSIVVPASTTVVVPEAVSARHAALTEPLSVALHGVRQSGLRAGDTTVIFGAGAIGLGIVGLAAAAGARDIVVSEPRAARREAALAMGADAVVDPTETDPVTFVRERTDGGADITIEAVGRSETLTQAIRSGAYGSTTAVLGVFVEEATIHPNDVMQAERTVVGSFAFRGGHQRDRGEFPAVLEMLADGRLDPEPMISDVHPLSEIETAFEVLLDPEQDAVKLLIES
ncbi:zinc-binding dehydrogenase [Halomarina halobia]|uniref:Zinc-binding dehydrogenase n=1 Tax=Halomarina halobia TaxID=3033386 RepID=A0ABD6AEZ3_9EURY|nr:zinc-binding dehydrogenase [Halomarina sp. PSR21]